MFQFSPQLQITLAGRSFNSMVGAAGTGITIPIYSTTSPTCALWNPLGTNKLIVPTKFMLGVAATATAAITSLALSQVINTGSAFATGLPIAAWTDANVYNGRIARGVGSGNAGRVGVATTTLTTAGNAFYNLGLSQATTALAPGWVWLEHEFDDALALDPGTLVHLVGDPLAPVETMVVHLQWNEYDFVPMS